MSKSTRVLAAAALALTAVVATPATAQAVVKCSGSWISFGNGIQRSYAPDQFCINVAESNTITSLVFQGDGNLVQYTEGNLQRGNGVVWASGTEGRGAQLVAQGDGNLVIYDRNSRAVWSSGTSGSGGTGRYLVAQEDHNTVLYRTGVSPFQALWWTFTRKFR